MVAARLCVLGQTLSAFKKVKTRLKSSIQLLGIVFVIHGWSQTASAARPCILDKRNTLANEVISDAIENHKDLIFKSIIGLNIKIEEAQVNKQNILSYSSTDRGSEQYRALGREVLLRMGE